MRFRRLTRFLATSLLVLGSCFFGGGVLHAAGQRSTPQRSALTVVKDYFAVLDADLKAADFSNLGSAYASNATLKIIDVNGAAVEYHGLAAIVQYWKHRGMQVPGLHFTADRIIPLDTLHVEAFERTTTNKKIVLAGRCAHLFKVRRDKIVFDAYYNVAFTKSELGEKQ